MQALAVFEVDEAAAAPYSGTIAVCRFFHHYFAVAKQIFHPIDGVPGMAFPEECLPVLGGEAEGEEGVGEELKEMAGRRGSLPHRFMPLPLDRFKLGAMSAYIRLAEEYRRILPLQRARSDGDNEEGGAAWHVPGGEIEGVTFASMAAHIVNLHEERGSGCSSSDSGSGSSSGSGSGSDKGSSSGSSSSDSDSGHPSRHHRRGVHLPPAPVDRLSPSPPPLEGGGEGDMEGRLLGPTDLFLEAVPVKPGDLVLWDSAVPHHNVAASATNARPRMCAYMDIAPADAGFYLPPEEQIHAQAARLRSSRMGRPEAPENEDERRCVVPQWEALPLDYRLRCVRRGEKGRMASAVRGSCDCGVCDDEQLHPPTITAPS